MADKTDLTALFDRLSGSAFRRRFRLLEPERAYLHRKGLDVVLKHAAEFIEQRLAPAVPANDGKQTPFRHHPVFIAQHATATCCRGCLEQWHSIQKGSALTPEEKEYVSTLKSGENRLNILTTVDKNQSLYAL